jgi:hypothetical protein
MKIVVPTTIQQNQHLLSELTVNGGGTDYITILTSQIPTSSSHSTPCFPKCNIPFSFYELKDNCTLVARSTAEGYICQSLHHKSTEEITNLVTELFSWNHDSKNSDI